MNRLSLCFAVFLLASTFSVRAQSKAAADANAAAYELYSNGDYKAAADAYEQLLKNFPTDSSVPGAQVQLAFSDFFLGKYDDAITMLTKANAGPPLPADVKQLTDGLMPQILLAKASAMPSKDPKRKSLFQDAIKQFGDYITKYPQAQDLEQAIYSRALAEFQNDDYDSAVKDLEMNIKRFPQSGTIANSKNLLAITLATEGSKELAKGDSADKAKAFGFYKQATDYLKEIINKKEDVALMNDANFQLGEILLNQAGYSSDAEKPALYAAALAAFQAVAPKDQIVAYQQQKLKEFPDKKRQAIMQHNEALRKQLDRDYEREFRKLTELQGKPDQTATALVKTAEIYFQAGKYNEARVVLHHVLPFLNVAEDQKLALYLIAMTYAMQNAVDRAPAAYDAFQAKFKGDAMADNLPVALGNMYLALNKTSDAIHYYDESLAIYPSGRYAGVSVVQKATAEAAQGLQADALKTFQSYLAKNPPPEIGVIAQFGLAGIYKDTQKWDDAITAYKTVKEKYPGTPQAVDSDYWIGVCTQQKGDNAGAIPILDAFAKANPKNPLTPLALYVKGGAQIALGQKEDAIATLATVANDYPQSQPAPFTYFTRAQIRSTEGKADDVVALMKQFIEKYPRDEKIYFAYDSIAQTELNRGKTDEALAAYREFVDKYSENPQAAEALAKVAEIQRTKADALGRYLALNDQERAQWNTLIEGSIASAEELLQKYPDSPAVALDLQTLLADQRMLVGAEKKQPADVEKYFQGLADAAASPKLKSKLLFTLASFVAPTDKDRAFAIMSQAYSPDIVYSPADLDIYGIALIEQKKLDDASAVFDKLAADYPVPANMSPAQAATAIQEAQATVLFGKGRVAQAKGQTAEAGKLFEQLKALYPWSPKVLEANYGIAASYQKEGRLDDAVNLLTAIIRAPTATAELRANSMLLGGDIMVDKMNAATDAKQKSEYLDAAIDYYIKIAQFYAGVPSAAAEGLWKGGQLLEQQASAATDPKFKTQQLGRAKSAYQQLIKDYPSSEYVPKAQERLSALGGGQ